MMSCQDKTSYNRPFKWPKYLVALFIFFIPLISTLGFYFPFNWIAIQGGCDKLGGLALGLICAVVCSVAGMTISIGWLEKQNLL